MVGSPASSNRAGEDWPLRPRRRTGIAPLPARYKFPCSQSCCGGARQNQGCVHRQKVLSGRASETVVGTTPIVSTCVYLSMTQREPLQQEYGAMVRVLRGLVPTIVALALLTASASAVHAQMVCYQPAPVVAAAPAVSYYAPA